ncbi:hypothetical protein L7F22_034855 [Adiantum nelumboides]|nr:hypothetical protein [Adiantum nelumboides]
MKKRRHFPLQLQRKMAPAKASHRKTKSLWNWVPVRAFAKIRHQKFYCVFSIFIQTIDGLPSYMDGLRLVVQLERKSKRWQTMPSRVFQHIVGFDETLHIETIIYGRKANMQDHSMKFLPKDYILSVIAIDAEEHFLFNRHRIDLSRLLPVFVEGFWEPEKPMSSTASFKLGGKAEGAVLVATFDFEVLNEELRSPILFFDGNASARFGGSSLRRVSRAVKSLPNSPNPSPFVRRADHHFTSPCSSDAESTDSPGIGKFNLDSSAKETEEWSVYDYSSSDEERFQALKNDPLSLDAFTETEIVTASPFIRVKKGLGSLGGFSSQLHLANRECVAKVPLARKLGVDASVAQTDVQSTLSGHETQRDSSKLPCGNKQMGELEDLEKNAHDSEVAADKFCINVEFVNSSLAANVSLIGVYDVVKPARLQQHSIGDRVLSSSGLKLKNVDSGVFLPDQVELLSELTEKHLLVEGAQPFSLEKVECTPIHCQNNGIVCSGVQAHSAAHSQEAEGYESGFENHSNGFVEGLDRSASSPGNDREGCTDVQTQPDGKAPVNYSWEDVGHENGLENFLEVSVGVSNLSALSPRNENGACLDVQTPMDGKAPMVAYCCEDVGHANWLESFADLSVDVCDYSASSPLHEIGVCMDAQAHCGSGVPVVQSRDDARHEIGLENTSESFAEGFDLLAVSSRNNIGGGMDIHIQLDGKVLAFHSWEGVGPAKSLDNLSGLSIEASGLSASSPKCETAEVFHFNAEDELSLEANVVVEDFFDLLEREEESTDLIQYFPPVCTAEVKDKQMPVIEECWSSSLAEEKSFFSESFKPGEPCPTIKTFQDRPLTCNHASKLFSNYDLSDECEDDLGLFPIIEAAELEMRKAAQSLQSKERAKMLEDAETEALMREWGLSDKVFERPLQKSLLCSASEMCHLSHTTSLKTLMDGGYLRAVSAQHFCCNLMMQVSKPVVIPASSSLCSFDVLRSLASRGLEDLTTQAFTKLPLEDLEGSSVDHVLRGVEPFKCYSSAGQRPCQWLNLKESPGVLCSSTRTCVGYKPFRVEAFSERLVAFEDLTHVALHIIEPLSIEGLKLQCNISKEAPCSLALDSLKMQIDKNDQVASEGLQEESLVNAGRQVENPETESSLEIALSLDDWLSLFEHMKMAEGEFSVAGEVLQKEESSKTDEVRGWATWAHHSSSFTLAIRLQLRDPQRYYEAVGASMLALVQVEIVGGSKLSSIDGDMDSSLETCSGPQLRLTAAHIAGVKQSEQGRLHPWGTKKQLQSASRWLMANFKASSLRNVMSQASAPSEAKALLSNNELLWSISSCAETPGRNWREPENNFCPCIRNPDIIFSANESL